MLRPGAAYVHTHRRRHRETFIPLGHLPGQRLEADFGHIHVDFPDGRRQIPFLVTAGPTRTLPSFWLSPSSAPRRSSKAWSGPSSSSAAYPRRSGGTTPGPLPRSFFKDANAGSIPATPSWPDTTSSILSSACRLGATRSSTPRDRQGRATPVRHSGAPREGSR